MSVVCEGVIVFGAQTVFCTNLSQGLLELVMLFC